MLRLQQRSTHMDNLSKQIEEVEALTAIYDNEFQTEDEENRSYSIKISSDTDSNVYVKFYVKFPATYPSESPPTFEISAPHLKHDKKMCLSNILEDVYLSHIGQNVVFQWIEKIREELQSYSTELVDESTEQMENKLEEEENIVIEKPKLSVDENKNTFICPRITHGDVIVDRKSSFQGHAAAVKSIEEVRCVLAKLKENRKIQQATHNIYAYRIFNENSKKFLHDCDDDGENQAGGRLLHLLEIMNAKNVMVVVSRWYGGIHLGPDRFRHINNAARQVLTTANLIPENHK